MKVALTPSGSPTAVSFTVPLKPPLDITRTLLVVFLPCATVTTGDAESEKSAAPAFGEGSTSYKGCTGSTPEFS